LAIVGRDVHAELVGECDAPCLHGFTHREVLWRQATRDQSAHQRASHVSAANESRPDVHDYFSRGPNIAVPMRTSVAPSAIAASKSTLVPIDRVSSPRPCSFR